jgi:hypothetical protein
MKTRIIAGLIAGLAISSNAFAATVFYQGFNDNSLLSLGNGGLAITSLPVTTGLTVSGNIDVVASPNGYGIPQPTSNFVDLDGTTGPGKLTSNQSYAYNAGDTITLSFFLGGNERGYPSDVFNLAFTSGPILLASNISGTGYFSGSLAGLFGSGSQSLSLASTDDFILSTISFTAGAAGTFGFSLGTTSADNVGPIIDEIKLDISAVPGPMVGAGLPGLVIALGALVALRRRRMGIA